MGKVEQNKQQKLDALFDGAYKLFQEQDISKTSIDDIVKSAGVAKGTFYLYFKDKNELRDRLIARTAGNLFRSAYLELQESGIKTFEDKIIFIVDYILEVMYQNQSVLRFISKNLSWGIFRQAITENGEDAELDILQLYRMMLVQNQGITIREPEIMLFLIIELASSTSYSTILENDPISFAELKPFLNESIRAIIRNHIVTE